MIDKDPTHYSILYYLLIVGLACWGGLVNYIHKVRSGASRVFNFTELLGELLTSGFSGILAFWLCELMDVPPLASVVVVAVAGHMGARSIFLIENFLDTRLKRYLESTTGGSKEKEVVDKSSRGPDA